MSSTSMNVNGVYTCTLGARPVVTRPIKSGRVVVCNASKVIGWSWSLDGLKVVIRHAMASYVLSCDA
jgi:hypothetical protein